MAILGKIKPHPIQMLDQVVIICSSNWQSFQICLPDLPLYFPKNVRDVDLYLTYLTSSKIISVGLFRQTCLALGQVPAPICVLQPASLPKGLTDLELFRAVCMPLESTDLWSEDSWLYSENVTDPSKQLKYYMAIC